MRPGRSDTEDMAVDSERAGETRTFHRLVLPERVIWRALIIVWVSLALALASQVRTYHGAGNAGAYMDLFGHHVVVEWRGHPGICVDCD